MKIIRTYEFGTRRLTVPQMKKQILTTTYRLSQANVTWEEKGTGLYARGTEMVGTVAEE